MDDRDLRPRHHRNPSRWERALDFLLTLFAFTVGGVTAVGFVLMALRAFGLIAW